MADLEHITAEGETYDIADATARTNIESLQTENAELKEKIAEMEEEISELNSDLASINIFELGEAIPNGSDLNDYTTPGNYRCADSTVAPTIVNGPIDNVGYRLLVMTTSSATRYIQIALTNDRAGIMYRLYLSTGWTSWRTLSYTS